MSSKKISLSDWQQQLGAAKPPAQQADYAGSDSQLVYSTDTGRITENKTVKNVGAAFSDGFLRLKRETKGRNGKAVITIAGIAEPAEKLNEIAGLLKKKCGCGGAVKDGIIEIQGDKRDVIQQELTRLGYKHKWSGG